MTGPRKQLANGEMYDLEIPEHLETLRRAETIQPSELLYDWEVLHCSELLVGQVMPVEKVQLAPRLWRNHPADLPEADAVRGVTQHRL